MYCYYEVNNELVPRIKKFKCVLEHIVEVNQRISGKTNRNGQVEKRIATDKWKNESQRTSRKTNRNGKWKNKSQRTSGKPNRFTGRFANWTSTLSICP